MSELDFQLPPRPQDALLIEGYASLFGVPDRSGDVVRPGAFSSSIARRDQPMLLQHKSSAVIGHWVRVVEDARGLFVRGLIESATGRAAIETGLSGLSIGFRPQVWTSRLEGGRLLVKIELIEISLVQEPMLETARFRVVAG
ncbi:MAG: HK97 family phage prohead protease [Pseudomonadota bacterium]